MGQRPGTGRQHEGGESRGRGDDRVAQAARRVQSPAVAPGLGERKAPRGEDEAVRRPLPRHRRHAEPRAGQPPDRFHARGGDEPRPGLREPAQERVEDGAGAVGRREVLPGRLETELHSQGAHPPDRARLVEGSQDGADERARPSPVVLRGDAGIGDVAAPSAADEDLGARLARPVQEHDPRSRCRLRGKDARRQPGRARSDDQDIGGLHRVSAGARSARSEHRWRRRGTS